MSNPNPPAAAPLWIRRLGLVGLIAYAVYLSVLFNPIATGADASGYLNSARLLAAGQLTTQSRVAPELTARWEFHWVPLGFSPEPKHGSTRLSPTYPVGMPLQFAAAGKLAGWTVGPFLVCIGGALAGIWLLYLVARELGVSPLLAVAGAVALAASPLFIFMAQQPLSDVHAATWCLAAAYAALRVRRRPTGVGWALACGAASALAVLVRPSNIIVLPAIAVLVGHVRPLLLVAVGGLPASLALLAYQQHLYGHPLRSGYGSIFEVFRPSNFQPTLHYYARWLPALLAAPLLLLPLGGAVRGRRVAWATLVAWVAGVALFYAFYDVTDDAWWCLRFLLPAFPALILAALLGAENLVSRVKPPRLELARSVLALVLVTWTATLMPRWSRQLGVLTPAAFDPQFVETTTWLKRHAAPNAVVGAFIGSGAIYYYTDFPILRWDLFATGDSERYAAQLHAAGRPFYALLFADEEQQAWRDHLRGKWRRLATFPGATVWQWTGP